jgi:hypothetical protein
MEFRLPENLHHELLAYDPALKAMAKVKANAIKTTSASKKSKYPIGNINDLIPTNIVSAAKMQGAVDDINGQNAPNKYTAFNRRVVETNYLNTYERNELKAILYYYESTWIAAWLPNEDEDYLYGFSYAISKTKADRKQFTKFNFNNAALDVELTDMTLKKYGRVEYYTYTKKVTANKVQCGNGYHWNPLGVKTYTEKGKHIKENCINLFYNQLKKSIPTWQDELQLFARVDKTRNNMHYLFAQYISFFPSIREAAIDPDWLPNAANLTPYIQKKLNVPADILNKPFVQKELQAACNKAIETFQNPNTIKFSESARPMLRFVHYMYGIKWLHAIWQDTPIDYYQTYKDALSCLDYNNWRMTYVMEQCSYAPVREWLRQHMPILSILLILDKYYKEEYEPHIGTKYNEHDTILCYPLADTFAMLSNIFEANKTIDPPKRWRITEFHDHVQEEAWKIKNPKMELPQDLFPTPIKVKHKEQTWTFFQPMDTHELSNWGQAVRNCVGNGGYAEDVKKHKQFIVLCMIDGKPKFTIQLKLHNGLMSVQQIKNVGNKSLSSQEEAEYSETFKQALQLRSKVAA